MPIVCYDGVEGAGKTMMMTRDLRYHHKCGGTVYATPGYELLGGRGKVLSKPIKLEELMKLLLSGEIGFVIAFDEIQNMLNHHNWFNIIVDVLTYAGAAQRRKLSMGILATTPVFEWLPADLRRMFHEAVHLQDYHWTNKAIPIGTQSLFVREDLRGMLSGRIGKRTKPKIFHMDRYRKYTNTYSIVEPSFLLRKTKIKKEETIFDAQGNIIESSENTAAMVEEYGKKLVPRDINSKGLMIPKIFRVICDLVQEGYQTMSLSELGQKIRSETGIRSTDNIIAREYLGPLNCKRINNKNENAVYALPELAGE